MNVFGITDNQAAKLLNSGHTHILTDPYLLDIEIKEKPKLKKVDILGVRQAIQEYIELPTHQQHLKRIY